MGDNCISRCIPLTSSRRLQSSFRKNTFASSPLPVPRRLTCCLPFPSFCMTVRGLISPYLGSGGILLDTHPVQFVSDLRFRASHTPEHTKNFSPSLRFRNESPSGDSVGKDACKYRCDYTVLRVDCRSLSLSTPFAATPCHVRVHARRVLFERPIARVSCSPAQSTRTPSIVRVPTQARIPETSTS